MKSYRSKRLRRYKYLCTIEDISGPIKCYKGPMTLYHHERTAVYVEWGKGAGKKTGKLPVHRLSLFGHEITRVLGTWPQ